MNEEKKVSVASVLLALLKAGCYLLLFLGSQVLVTTFYTVAITVTSLLNGGGADPTLLLDDILRYTPAITLLSAVLALVLLWIFFRLRGKKPLAEISLTRTAPRLVAAGGVITPALYALVTLVLSLLPERWLDAYAEASAGLSSTGVLAFLATAIAAPLAEEVIFRGLILSRLARVMPGWLAVLLSALLFGLCHGQAVWVGYAFVLGAIFGWMALRARSILPSLLAHVVFNAIGHFAVVLEDAAPFGIVLAALFAISIVGCLLARKGIAELLRPSVQPEVP